MKELYEFSDASGSPLERIPSIGGRELDLHLLYLRVTQRGGFERATAERRWTAIAESMNIHSATSSHLAPLLKKHYQSLLLPFERYRDGIDPPPPALAAAARSQDQGAAAAAAADGAVAVGASGGGLMAKRSSAEVVKISDQDESANAGIYEEEVGPGREK